VSDKRTLTGGVEYSNMLRQSASKSIQTHAPNMNLSSFIFSPITKPYLQILSVDMVLRNQRPFYI
jgi:hypothetical protein